MKKFLGFIALALWAFVSVNAGDKVTRNVSKLPAEAQKSISSNFPGQEISYIKIDRELLKGTIYEVVLVNGTEVDFTSNGQWKEVDCKKSAVPNAYIPVEISTYVKNNFAGQFIKRIEREVRHYDVELNNGLELKFDLKGNLKHIDD